MSGRKVTREKFRNWLLDKKGSETVGKSENDCDCPIATFTKQKFQTDQVTVDGRGIITVRGRELTHEDWMTSFVQNIDSVRDPDQIISAYEALDTLDHLTDYDY